MGKALKGQGNVDFAVRAFINSYNDIDKNEAENIKIDVMLELTSVCVCVPRNRCKYIRAHYTLNIIKIWNTLFHTFFS